VTRKRDTTVDDSISPAPCPRCGATDRLFTPNARRDPYAEPAAYEPAWQCTRCGLVEFIAPFRSER
jgi:hypothetical protein